MKATNILIGEVVVIYEEEIVSKFKRVVEAIIDEVIIDDNDNMILIGFCSNYTRYYSVNDANTMRFFLKYKNYGIYWKFK